jgi:hypothetical protein
MSWRLRCECGERLSAATEELLVAATERHVVEQHPALGAAPPRADLLAMAEHVVAAVDPGSGETRE